jgi:hypothetical protein
MSSLSILSDADLDAVNGGNFFRPTVVVRGGNGGNGGNGGTAINGASVSSGWGEVEIIKSNLSVNNSTANANGGAGGAGGAATINL